MNESKRTKCLSYFFLLCGCRQYQAVDHDIGSVDPERFRRVDNLLCNSQTFFRRCRYSVLVQSKPENNTSVFLNNRKDGLHHFLFPVDGINQGFAVIYPTGAFQRLRIGTVNLKRESYNFLDIANQVFHDGRFVDSRHPDIHIQNVRAGLFLQDCLQNQFIQPVSQNCFAQFLATGRIDSLSAYDRAFLTDYDIFGSAGHDRPSRIISYSDGNILQRVVNFPYVLRRRSAATADNICSGGDKFADVGTEFLHGYVVGGDSVLIDGEPGVRLNKNGFSRDG